MLNFENHLIIVFYIIVATVKQHYDLVLSIVEKYLSEAEMAVMKLSLSLRIYSARVEMFSQMASFRGSNLDCINFVDIGGRYTCSLDKIDKLIELVSQNFVRFYFYNIYKNLFT